MAAGLMAAGCAPQLIPTPNLCVGAGGAPFAAVPPALRSDRVRIVYATDRERIDGDAHGPPAYGHQRSRSLAFGRAELSLGGVSWDELVRQSCRSDRERWLPLRIASVRERGRMSRTPGPLRLRAGQAIGDPWALHADAAAEQALHALVRAELRHTPRKEAFIYVHGFNSRFDDSLHVMASLWHFLGREGVPMVYSWPAGIGLSVVGYNYDRESGEFTVYHLKQFLRAVARCPELQKVHLIAHSRGSDVLLTALRELHIEARAAGRDTRQVLRLGHVVLAAPDMDFQVYQQRVAAERLSLVPERLTLYLSQGDLAITFAEHLFWSIRRLARLRPEDLSSAQLDTLGRMPEISLIDARVTTDPIGHVYFYSNPAVSSDLILLLRDNRPPGEAHGRPLRATTTANYWELEDGYPPRR